MLSSFSSIFIVIVKSLSRFGIVSASVVLTVFHYFFLLYEKKFHNFFYIVDIICRRKVGNEINNIYSWIQNPFSSVRLLV